MQSPSYGPWFVKHEAREWVVLVLRVDSATDTVIRRLVKTEDDAVSTVAELAEAIESCQLAPTAE